MKIKPTPAAQKLQTGGTNFLVSIYHQENHSWQGSIQWLDTGKKIHFRSELELMNLMHSALQTSQSSEDTLRDWEEEQKSNAC